MRMATVAIKLHEMLSSLKAYPHPAKSKTRQDVWFWLAKEKFGGNTVKMYEALSAARREIVRQLDEVEQTPGSSVFLVSQLDKVFNQLELGKLQANWSCEMDAIDSLLSIDDLLKASDYGEPDIELELDDVLERLNQLKSEIKNSDIQPAIKKFLLEAVSSLTLSIDHFYIHGEAGLRRAYATAVGNLLAVHKIEGERTDEEKEVYANLKEALTIIDLALSAGQNGIALAHAVGPLLG